MTNLSIAGWGMLGALALEGLHYLALADRLSERKFRAMHVSTKFWARVIVHTLLGGLAAAVAGATHEITWAVALATGAGARSGLSGLLSSVAASKSQKMGATEDAEITWSDVAR